MHSGAENQKQKVKEKEIGRVGSERDRYEYMFLKVKMKKGGIKENHLARGEQ